MTPLITKLRSAGEAERTLAPASGLFDEAADEIEKCHRIMQRAAAQFSYYAELHALKPDPAKAATNQKWADELTDATVGADR